MEERNFWILVMGMGILSWAIHQLMEGIDAQILLIMVALIAVHVVQELLEGEHLGMEQVISTLMVAVGIITYFAGLHFEGVMLLTFYGMAEVLESLALERAQSGIRSLMEYMPRKARIIKGNTVEEVLVEDLNPGDLIIVPTGERVPADGVVVKGDGILDISVVTGESEPVRAGEGDFIYSGSLVIEGSVTIKAIRVGEESLVSRILKLVEEFRREKSRRERRIHTFSKYYMPAMLGLTVPVYLALGLKPALVLLATACPSAFIIAASSTNLTALSLAARMGILFKGSPPLEASSKIRTVAIDKTGTLTLGKLRVRKTNLNDEQLRLLASLELASAHPVAEAIVDYAKERGLNLIPPDYVKEVPGSGISGVVNGNTIIAGKAEFLGIEGAKGVVYVKINDQLVGYVELDEDVNPAASLVVKRLREKGKRVLILSGDKREKVLRVARHLGVDESYYELTPEEKLEIIKKLEDVAMVGDGINDAPALAAADLGIAVGGLEASMEAGDVVLVSGIGSLPTVFDLGEEVKKAFWTNMALISLSKGVAISLGVVGYIPLWAAIAVGDDGGLILTLINVVRTARKIIKGRGYSTSTSLKDSQSPWRLQ